MQVRTLLSHLGPLPEHRQPNRAHDAAADETIGAAQPPVCLSRAYHVMKRIGCHTWTAPDPEDIERAARTVPDAPEVWTAATNPHLATVRQLWPGATLYTVGTTPPTEHLGQWHVHRGPGDLELLTLDRPRHTVVIPWP